MSENMKFWDKHADIDPKFTKPITGKQYKGTSPNPQYIIRCLTDMFGPAGHGFGWKVLDEGFQPLGDEVLHWCRIWFWTQDNSKGFESYGQTKAYMKTRNGMMSDEDAPKKSLTDAVIKAASHMGVAANIFLGRWDDQKYVQQVNEEYRKEDAKEAKTELSPADLRDKMNAFLKEAKDVEDLERRWGHKKTADAIKKLPEPMRNEVQATYKALKEKADD